MHQSLRATRESSIDELDTSKEYRPMTGCIATRAKSVHQNLHRLRESSIDELDTSKETVLRRVAMLWLTRSLSSNDELQSNKKLH
eukprot:CAMPEP_0203964386 /NCGR_PEP_ID=MMETSP0359-20131031/94144_1 /ASSEMBLY_ACC=CAM_ASM_000338 /TAXON_ID=268821 /ORGANISM="Scrippsiella Hangoei, Strain SHTV-5" /LENGTH=84 /DNA_ID=CAMNT_0050900773 /DNA_START=35 /DNA_END=289 /DNA_ORIENTATION=-